MRWLKLSECQVDAVRREVERLRDEATDSVDIPGLYVNDAGTTYKVVWTAIERDQRGAIRKRHGGLAIRRALPGTVGPTPLAELRPDTELVTARRRHGHLNGDTPHTHDSSWPFEPGGGDARDAHLHETRAKYVFLPSEPLELVWLQPRVTGPDISGRPTSSPSPSRRPPRAGSAVTSGVQRNGGRWSSAVGARLPTRPPDRDRRQRGRKTRKTIGPVALDGAEFDVVSELRRARTSEAMRIDVNPIALEMFGGAERIYFGIEGCILIRGVASHNPSRRVKYGRRRLVASIPNDRSSVTACEMNGW